MPYTEKSRKHDYSKQSRAKRRKEWLSFFMGEGHTRKVALQLAKWAEKKQ